jgi:RNA polymerase sigma-70 factor (ECF subfamily)
MIFQRVWARTVMDLAMARVRAEYALAGTSGLFDYLHSFLPDNEPICSRAEAAQRLEMTASAFDTAFHRMKRRYKDHLRREIAETLEAPTKEDVENELAALMTVFGR